MDSEGSQRKRIRDGLALLLLTAGLLAISMPRDEESGPADAARSQAPVPSPPPESSPLLETEDGTLPVRVVFLNALTGREVPGVRWSAHAPRRGSEASAPAPDAPSRRGGDSAVLALPFPRIEVEPPDGYVCLPPRMIPSRRVHGARVGVLEVHLHPEAAAHFDSTLSLLDTMDGTAVGAEARVGGYRIELDAANEDRHPGRLRGVPFMPGEELRLILKGRTGDPGRGAWCGTAATGGEGWRSPDLEWVARMGASPEVPIRFELGISGRGRGIDLSEEDPEGPSEDPWQGLSLGESEAMPPSSGPVDMSVHGPVRLQLLDRSGTPAPGVRVAVRSVRGRTGKDGRVTLPGVVGGEHPVRVLDEGWCFPSVRAGVAGEEGTDLVVRELVGGELEVRVLDRDMEPVPRAALAIVREDRRSWWDVDDAGVQRLDPYVGADGRRVLTHVPPGTLHVRAKVGTREGQARVEVVDGARQVVTITLPGLASR